MTTYELPHARSAERFPASFLLNGFPLLRCRMLQRCNREWIRTTAQQEIFDCRVGFVFSAVKACLGGFCDTPLEAFDSKVSAKLPLMVWNILSQEPDINLTARKDKCRCECRKKFVIPFSVKAELPKPKVTSLGILRPSGIILKLVSVCSFPSRSTSFSINSIIIDSKFITALNVRAITRLE